MTVRHVAGSNTSKSAADSIRPAASNIREEVYTAIRLMGEIGLTCDEAEEWLGYSHQTTSARIHELKKGSDIKDSGERRATRSGRAAVVYVSR